MPQIKKISFNIKKDEISKKLEQMISATNKNQTQVLNEILESYFAENKGTVEVHNLLRYAEKLNLLLMTDKPNWQAIRKEVDGLLWQLTQF